MSFLNKDVKNALAVFVPGQSKNTVIIPTKPEPKTETKSESKSGRLTKSEKLEKKKAMASAQIAELIESNPTKKQVADFIQMRINQLIEENE